MKPLALISIFGILGSLVLGVMNRSKLIDTMKQKDEYNRQIMSNFDKTDGVNKSTAEENAKYAEEKTKYERDKYAKETEDKTATTKAAEAKALIAESETVQREIDTINAEIAKKLANFPGGPDQLQTKLEALKADIDTLSAKLAVVDKEVEVATTAVAEQGKTISRLNEQQTQRTKAISLSQREGIIIAVNPDWAFCIINMGKTDGVSTDSRLLVKRGAQLIGKLNITQIENNQTVAEIDTKSLKKGVSVQPGDQVIFDNAN